MPPDCEKKGYSDAFQVACINGDLPKVQEALASGKLSAKDLDNGLFLATSKVQPDIVAALFDAGVPMSPSTIGSLFGKEDQSPRVVRLYLDRGLKPTKCTTSRGEPLLRFLPAACARLLLERGADPNRCGPKKIPPLASAVAKASEDDGALFDLLVEYGATKDSSLFFHALPWSRANTEFKIRFLLAKGLDPNATSAVWGTPLHCAIRFTMLEVIKILLEAGADPTARVNCEKFANQSPVELAERGISIYSDMPSMQVEQETILKLLTDAQAGQATATKNTSNKAISTDSVSSRTRSRTKHVS